MAALNKVILAGNLTRDPEVRYTPGGTAVADLNLAINRTYVVQGEQREETCFVGVVAWGRQAELCGEYLAKGAPVLVEGSLQFDQWQTEGGEKRSRLRVKADRVQFLGRPKRSAEMGDAPAGFERPPPAPEGRKPPENEGGGRGEKDDDLPF